MKTLAANKSVQYSELDLLKVKVIRPLAAKVRCKGWEIANAAKALNKSRAQVYRYIKAFKLNPCVDAFANNASMATRRLAPDIEEIIQQCIEQLVIGSSQFIAIPDVYTAVCERCRKVGLVPPCERTVRRRIKALPEIKLAQGGQLKGPSDKRDHKPQHHIVARPLQEVQIDHTKMDILVDFRNCGLRCRRPWLTLAVDVATRLIYGYYIGIKAPSSLNTMMVLIQATSDKTEWLRRQSRHAQVTRFAGLGDELMPLRHIPEMIHTDLGSDFKSSKVSKACSALGIKREFRPAGKKEFGGHIERLIGTFMARLKGLPGATGSNTGERKWLARKNAKIMTLRRLESWLCLEILRYNSSYHEGIRSTPLMQYRDLSRLHGESNVEMLGNARILHAFGVGGGRRVQPNGITIGGRNYYHPELVEYDGMEVYAYLNGWDDSTAILSFDGQSKIIELTLQPDGLPIGHVDFAWLRTHDTLRKFELDQSLEDEQEIRSAQSELIAESENSNGRINADHSSVLRRKAANENRAAKSLLAPEDVQSFGQMKSLL